MAAELKVISDFYDLMKYLTGRIEKFPRYHRYTLGAAMEGRLQSILALLVRAKYSGKPEVKVGLLTDANVELEVLRFQVRLGHELKALPAQGHGQAVALMEQVGCQVGGWLRAREGAMKRTGGLWEQVVRWDNLLLAARKAQRGKRGRAVVQRFNFFREWELLRLQGELVDGRYTPGPFRSHWIDRPKRRLISAAPYRDRVVHHALMNVLEPILDRRFHPHSYACRKGKGTHAAADRLQKLMRRRGNGGAACRSAI